MPKIHNNRTSSGKFTALRSVFICVFILSFLLSGQVALAESSVSLPPAAVPSPDAEAAILMDGLSGQVLYGHNENEHLAIASITKIMTAIIVLENGDLDQEVTIGPEVLDRKEVYGTLLYLEPGEIFTRRDLLYALLLNSANDAAVAIAVDIAGSTDAFVKLMNEKAREIGAVDTHFVNPDGLPAANHYSSAFDMALIARYALQKPVFAEIVKTKERDFPRSKPDLPNKLENINKILGAYEGADGVKTGYTSEAGSTLVASATRNGRQLIVVELKAAPLGMYKDAENLFDYGFTHFTDKLLARKGQVLESVPIDKKQSLKFEPVTDIYGTFPVGEEGQFQLKVEPVNEQTFFSASEVQKKLDIFYNGHLVQSQPLLAIKVSSPSSFSVSALIGSILLTLLTLTFFALLLRLIKRRNNIRTAKRRR
jgi:D-alanyl-D-alanine carboxypeptidase (penicillin-binding protein 5/6)